MSPAAALYYVNELFEGRPAVGAQHHDDQGVPLLQPLGGMTGKPAKSLASTTALLHPPSSVGLGASSGMLTLRITTTATGRAAASKAGYRLIFAKGVASGGRAAGGTTAADFNVAWFTLDPASLPDEIDVKWTPRYIASFIAKDEPVNGARLTGLSASEVALEPGARYRVDSASGELVRIPGPLAAAAAGAVGAAAGFSFYNDGGWKGAYRPVIKNAAGDVGGGMPVWVASTGVPLNGRITATPVHKVRVWLGKYETGAAVLAYYETQVVEFGLSQVAKGQATLNDDLSGWSSCSLNAKTISPT